MPQAYLDKNIPLAYERLVIGGYRLYHAVDYIFGSSNETTSLDVMEDFSNMVFDAIEQHEFLQ